MKKVLIIVMVVVLCIGALLVGTALIMTKGNLAALGDDEREAARIDETAEVLSLTIDISSDNIKLVASDDENFHVDYYTSVKRPYTFTCENGIATVASKGNLPVFSMFSYNKPKDVVVYLPESLTQSVVIKTSSGDFISSKEMTIDSLYVKISSGNCTASNITAKTMDIHSSSGEVTITNCVVERTAMQLSSGNLRLIDCEVENINIDIASGNATLKNSTLTELDISVSSGNVNSERLVCSSIRSNNSSGNTSYNLVGKAADYTTSLRTSSGSLHLTSISENLAISTQSSLSSGSGAGTINCKCSSGNVHVTFID